MTLAQHLAGETTCSCTCVGNCYCCWDMGLHHVLDWNAEYACTLDCRQLWCSAGVSIRGVAGYWKQHGQAGLVVMRGGGLGCHASSSRSQTIPWPHLMRFLLGCLACSLMWVADNIKVCTKHGLHHQPRVGAQQCMGLVWVASKAHASLSHMPQTW